MAAQTPVPDPLDAALSSRQVSLSPSARYNILFTCWGFPLSFDKYQARSQDFDAYFHQYEKACEQLSPRGLGELTHKHILETFRGIVVGQKKECKQKLESEFTRLQSINVDEKLIDECILFAGRHILCLDLSEWQNSETIKEFMETKSVSKSTLKDSFRLSRSFNARTLNKVAGMKITWTRNLRAHLRLSDNDRELAVFHLVAVLDLYERSRVDIFPPEFLEETRRTLSLLLPSFDTKVRKWFRKEQNRVRKNLVLDPRASTCSYLEAEDRNVQKFDYWRDRLVVAKEVFDDHEPRGLLQFWRDDRKNVQWWTFWVAIIVFFFVVVQSVEGALHVYKAYFPSS